MFFWNKENIKKHEIWFVFWGVNSVIGAILVICGLYILLWGKSRETSDNNSFNKPAEAAHCTGISTNAIDIPHATNSGWRNHPFLCPTHSAIFISCSKFTEIWCKENDLKTCKPLCEIFSISKEKSSLKIPTLTN